MIYKVICLLARFFKWILYSCAVLISADSALRFASAVDELLLTFSPRCAELLSCLNEREYRVTRQEIVVSNSTSKKDTLQNVGVCAYFLD